MVNSGLMEITKPEEHEKVWGRELWIANNDMYCGKILELNGGFRCSIHHHKNKDETFFILEGLVFMEVGNESSVMEPGDILRLEPGAKHRFTGLHDSKIIEFSTHHEEGDSYRDVVSGKVPEDEFKNLCEKCLK